MEHVTCKTPDIYEYCDFNLYALVWYHLELRPNFNDENSALDRWLGVSRRIGSDMCYQVLTKSVTVITETNVQHVTRDDMLDTKTEVQVEIFNKAINEQLDDTNFRIQHGEGGSTLEDEYNLQQWDTDYGDNDPTSEEYGMVKGDTPLADADDLNHEYYFCDKYIGVQLILNKKYKMEATQKLCFGEPMMSIGRQLDRRIETLCRTRENL